MGYAMVTPRQSPLASTQITSIHFVCSEYIFFANTMQIGSHKNRQNLYFAKIFHILYDKPFSDNKYIIVTLSIILLNMLHVISHSGKYT